MTHEAQNHKDRKREPGSTIRLGRSTTEALRVLNLCPSLPADTFRHVLHLRSAGGAYKLLGKLKQAGLAEMERVEVGYLLADRPLGLWSLTELGRRATASAQQTRTGRRSCAADSTSSVLGARSRRRTRTNFTLMVAAYRLLAFLLTERYLEGQQTELCAWEQPWFRRLWLAEQDEDLRVQLAAGAVFETRVRKTDQGNADNERTSILLVPDLGTAPVASERCCAGCMRSGTHGVTRSHKWWWAQSIRTVTAHAPKPGPICCRPQAAGVPTRRFVGASSAGTTSPQCWQSGLLGAGLHEGPAIIRRPAHDQAGTSVVRQQAHASKCSILSDDIRCLVSSCVTGLGYNTRSSTGT